MSTKNYFEHTKPYDNDPLSGNKITFFRKFHEIKVPIFSKKTFGRGAILSCNPICSNYIPKLFQAIG